MKEVKEKQLQGQFFREMDEIARDESWACMAGKWPPQKAYLATATQTKPVTMPNERDQSQV